MRLIKIFFLFLVLSLLFLRCGSESNLQAELIGSKISGSNEKVTSAEVEIKEKWELPSILKEVSGIVYLDSSRFACVQDELGSIFIYNTSTLLIDREIAFGEAGDYEGLSVSGETAYVVRSDGKIYEVANWTSENKRVSEYTTFLTENQNVEGLCQDKNKNRLLLAIKGSEPGKKNYKGIYAFDLSSKKLAKEPVYKINFSDPVFKSFEEEGHKVIQPSEIGIHPISGDLYITDAKNPKVLIMGSSGKIKALYQLNKENFSQMEGMTFSSKGEFFISNEGKKEPGNIMKVTLKN